MTTKDKDNKENVIENIYEQPITADIILRPYTLTENIINQTKKINDENMGQVQVSDYWAKTDSESHRPTKSVKASQVFIDFQPSPTKTKKLQFIKQTFNQRSKKPYTCS
jgi:hypothetical protein